MIQSLADFTVAPIAPTSSIAPKELVGSTNFSLFLNDIHAVSAQPAEALTLPNREDGAGHRMTRSGHKARLETEETATGNAFPQSGTRLPSSVRGDEVTLVDDPMQNSPASTLRFGASGSDFSQERAERVQDGFIRPPAKPAASAEMGYVATSEQAQSGVNKTSLSPAPNPIPEPSAMDVTVSAKNASSESAPGSEVRVRSKPVESPSLEQPRKSAPNLTVGAKLNGLEIVKEQSQADPMPYSPKDQADAKQAETSKTQLNSVGHASQRKSPDPIALTKERDHTGRPLHIEVAASQPAAAAVQAGLLAKDDASPAKPILRSEKRLAVEQAVRKTATALFALANHASGEATSPSTQLGQLQPGVESNHAPRQHNAAIANGVAPASLPTSRTPIEAATVQSSASQLPFPAMPVSPQAGTPTPITDPITAIRLSAQLESTIEQLTETRSAAQANRPELTMRHHEFGAITMRLDATGGDLRATLSARDPGFVPAIQTALTERSVVASSDTASTAQKGHDQQSAQGNAHSGSQSGPFTASQGQGWNFGGSYGSSTGAGQGTSQPYAGQTTAQDDDSGSDRGGRIGRDDGPGGEGELFA
ncbi:hypothetical protein [uncultured Erythrobacter sp.]|uniref:hypothetical protein n=1 Tax=uncultured Erythrobacter sp. TaxID=263913 RepID=UPI002613CEC8|nr:hypothetical protein [uncultured Erythrobacter sp.]